MRLAFKTPIGRLGWIRAFLVLAALGGAILAWMALHGPRPVQRTDSAAAPPAAVPSSGNAPVQASAPATLAAPAPPAVAPQQAALAPSSIEVLVARNDTLDRIFRRLQLSLADLASMRS